LNKTCKYLKKCIFFFFPDLIHSPANSHRPRNEAVYFRAAHSITAVSIIYFAVLRPGQLPVYPEEFGSERRRLQGVCDYNPNQGFSVQSMPLILIDTEYGRARPVSMLIVVVLLAPLGPREPNNSPLKTSKETSETALTLWKIYSGPLRQ